MGLIMGRYYDYATGQIRDDGVMTGGVMTDVGMLSPREVSSPQEVSPKYSKPSTPVLTGTDVAGAGADILSRITEGSGRAAFADYANDLDYWKSRGKYWFDPEYDITPELDEYMANMPSAVDALAKSQVTRGVAKSRGGKAFEIIHGTGAKRASEGFAVGSVLGPLGGGIGAAVGGLVGLVEGIFGYKSAKEEDKKNKRRAIEEYKAELERWNKVREKKNIIINSASNAAALNFERERLAGVYTRDKMEKLEKAANSKEIRNSLMAAFSNSKGAQEQQRARFKNIWR
jgi:hypothetical protein